MGSEERLSEAEPSSSLLIPDFSVFPDFVVFPASWSGADASHIPALNTSPTSALHCFRTFHQSVGSPTNTEFYFVRSIMISLLLCTKAVISSGLSGLCASIARS